MSLWDAENADQYAMQLVSDHGVTRAGNALTAVGLGSSIAANAWYQLQLDLTFAGAGFTALGTVFGHTTASDPNSALSAQVGPTLTYTGTLSSTLVTPYEIGIVARGDHTTRDASVTNFAVRWSRGGSHPHP